MIDDLGKLDARRKRLLMRANRCGIHENDILLGGFAKARIAELDLARLEELDALMQENDIDVFQWITRKKPAPAAYETPLMDMVRAFNKID
ncbi:MAG: succinate dehydrogenase assembly factor 2 [Magnetospiraceae bacterium]